MSADAHVASARTLSLLLLFLVGLAVQISWSQRSEVELLREARKIFASWWLESDAADFLPGIGEVEVEEVEDKHGNVSEILEVTRRDGVRWSLDVTRPDRLLRGYDLEDWGDLEEESGEDIVDDEALIDRAYLDVLVGLAVDFGHQGTVKEADDFPSVFRALQDEVLGQSVQVPTINIGFDVRTASWILTALAALLGFLIRARLRVVFRDPQLGQGQPWLVLDAEGGFELLLGRGWLAAILAAPWVSLGSFVLFQTHVRFVEGSTTTAGPDAALLCFILAAGILGGWGSLTVANTVTALRRARGELTDDDPLPAD